MKHFFTYIKKEIKKHFFDYLILITGGVFFLIALNLFKGERLMEFLLLLIFVSLYIIWGFYHHLFKDKIHLKIVLEYILIGFTMIFLFKLIIFP